MKWNLLVILVLVLLVVSGCTLKPSTTPSPVPATPAPSPTTTPSPAPTPAAPSVTPTPTEPPTTPTPTPTPVPAATPPPTSTPSPAPEATIPIIDAHSPVWPETMDKLIQMMDAAGVASTILTAGMTSNNIGIVTPEELVSFASKYPGRIIPAVRTKVGTGEDYYKLLEEQVNMNQYGAMAEVLMYHGGEAPGKPSKLVVAHPEDENVQAAFKYALNKGWPFIMHLEFKSAGAQRDVFMTELKALLVQYPEHPFVLIHDQLDPAAVQQLIEAHDNIYFITADSIAPKGTSDSIWTVMFDGRSLAADWERLIIKHPDRFMLGFDKGLSDLWSRPYLDVVTLWRGAMKELPVEVANALAHGNAERLWHLPPVK